MKRPRSTATHHTGSDERPLHVLVVDDSAVVRQIMQAVLSQESNLTVTTAADPLIAARKMKQARPDVILLDLEMPRMDGLTFLRRLMVEDPIPVVICSGVARRGTEVALQALDEGAVDIVTKPMVGVAEFLRDSAVMLIDTVRAAACARVRPLFPAAGAPLPSIESGLPSRAVRRVSSRASSDRVIAIGASTGGPEALRHLLRSFPPDAPGCVIVQHMPEPFTAPFAKRLDESCRIEVKEAAEGDQVLCGRALVARGNAHLSLRRGRRGFEVEVRDGPLVSRHRPSVDVLFHSVARVAGASAVGVILTGMGSDGAEGLREMKKAGATTIAQDEQTCTVFGMPREAIALGAVDEVAPLPSIAEAILRRPNERSRRGSAGRNG